MAEPVRTTIVDKAGADALVAEVGAAMQALEAVLAAESEAVRAGRLRQGLADPERKGALAGAYMQGLEG